MRTLVVYYSQARGNTARIAKMIANHLDADIAKIETVRPYVGSYDEIVNQGQNEVEKGIQPEIKPLNVDIADYDRIIIGTPTWWYTMAPAVRTFLKSNDFSNKIVVPFQTHGGWAGHAIEDVKTLCQGATFASEKDIRFDSTGGDRLITPLKQIDNWVKRL